MALKRGDRGTDVKALQTDLMTLGYLTRRGVDGVFLEGTKSAIATYQRHNGLPATGMADDETVSRIQRLGFPAPIAVPVATPTALAKAPSIAPELPADEVAPPPPTLSAQPILPDDPKPLRKLSLGDRIALGAVIQLGEHETGGDNLGEAVARFKAATGQKPGSAWCTDCLFAAVVEYAPELLAETPGSFGLRPTSSAKNLMQQVAALGAFRKASKNYTPEIGSFVFFDRGSPDLGHVGIVVRVTKTHVITVEGNVADPRRRTADGGQLPWSEARPDAVRMIAHRRDTIDSRALGYASIAALEKTIVALNTLKDASKLAVTNVNTNGAPLSLTMTSFPPPMAKARSAGD